MGRCRSVTVTDAHSWISRQRRLVVRYERNLDIFRDFFDIARALIVLERS